MSFRDVKIKIPDRTRLFGWRHAPEAWAEIWEKTVCWVPASEEEGWLSELGETRRLCALRAPCVGWVESWRWKSSLHRKIVSLSPHVETFNSKVIIKFRTWTNFMFSDSYICLWTFYEHYVYFTYPYHGYVTLSESIETTPVIISQAISCQPITSRPCVQIYICLFCTMRYPIEIFYLFVFRSDLHQSTDQNL